jgi:hypothetical protein
VLLISIDAIVVLVLSEKRLFRTQKPLFAGEGGVLLPAAGLTEESAEVSWRGYTAILQLCVKNVQEIGCE